jgi:hypothetical protein
MLTQRRKTEPFSRFCNHRRDGSHRGERMNYFLDLAFKGVVRLLVIAVKRSLLLFRGENLA